jgi:hypothetical protein
MNARQLKRRFYARWSVSRGAMWFHNLTGTPLYGVGIGGWPVHLLRSPSGVHPTPKRLKLKYGTDRSCH